MAKRKIEWSIESEESLKEILEFYIERNGNKIYSNNILQQIKKTISLLPNKQFNWENNKSKQS